MKKLVERIIFGLLLFGTVAMQAQASRTWVSGVGDDANSCSRTAPCKTFTGAISRTTAGGEIDALDDLVRGDAITITIDGRGGQAALALVSGNNGIVLSISPIPYSNGIGIRPGFPFSPVENASDYHATTIVEAIPFDTIKTVSFGTQKEWYDATLAIGAHGINVQAGTKDVVISSIADFSIVSDKINDIGLPYSKGGITKIGIPPQTISSGTTKTIGEEVKLPKLKDVTGRWPTAASASSVIRSIQRAALCGGGFPPGGEPCAPDTVVGNFVLYTTFSLCRNGEMNDNNFRT